MVSMLGTCTFITDEYEIDGDEAEELENKDYDVDYEPLNGGDDILMVQSKSFVSTRGWDSEVVVDYRINEDEFHKISLMECDFFIRKPPEPDNDVYDFKEDATKGYLKLLLLTAASGDSGSGEAIQSNRDLSMILGAILKTQSRSVLVDVINKNGLQMSHNMLKQCRRDFSKIPILRKLLRVLEFLATKEILKILSIKIRLVWEWKALESQSCLWQSMTTNRCIKSQGTSEKTGFLGLSEEGSHHTITVMKESCSTQSHKRKNRWDQPGDSNKEPKLLPNINHMNAIGKEDHLETKADDGGANMDGDMPLGFAPSNKGHGFPGKVEIGHPQKKFTNRFSVSYGIPMPIVHQHGYPETEGLENWCIAPGIPFQPYPPLPVYLQNRSDMRDPGSNHQPVTSQSDRNPPRTCGSILYHAEIQGTNNHCNFQRGRGSQGMGRYFRKQKWNNSRLPPPWIRKQNGRGFMGNDFRNGNNMKIDSHYFTQNPHQETYY